MTNNGNHVWFSEEPAQEVRDASPDPIHLVSVMSPVDTEFVVPAHFHPLSVEFMHCVSGVLHATLDGREVTLRPEDGELRIEKGVVHSLVSPKGEHAEFQERTDQGHVKKRDFLRNLFRISDSEGFATSIRVMTLFYEDGDSFPAPGSKLAGKIMVWIVGGFIGSYLGLGKHIQVPSSEVTG